jgi:hypothetical protein
VPWMGRLLVMFGADAHSIVWGCLSSSRIWGEHVVRKPLQTAGVGLARSPRVVLMRPLLFQEIG